MTDLPSRRPYPDPTRSTPAGSVGPALLLALLLPVAALAQERVQRPPVLQVDRIEQEFRFIRGLVGDGLYPTALEQIRSFLKEWPDDERAEEVRLLEAEVYFLQQDFERAEQLLNAFLLRTPQSPLVDRALYRRGEARFKRQEWVGAAADFRAIADQHPNSGLHDRARYWLGEALLRQGDTEGARQAFQSVYKQQADSPVADYALYSMGWIAQEQEEFEDALAYYRQVIDTHPTSDLISTSLFKMGQCYFATGRYAEAADAMSQVLQLDLGTEVAANAGFLLGESYYHMGEFPLARRHYQEVVRDHPGSEAAPEAQLAIAWTWLKEDHPLEAATAFRRVAEDYPGHGSVGEARYREGVALREAGRSTDALQAFAAAVEVPANPWADDALLEAGLIHYREGRFPLARAAFERILETGGESPLAADAAEMVGECRLAEEGLEEADAAFERVIQTWPDTEAGRLALFQWSVVRLRRGAASEAAAGFERYRTRYPESELTSEALYQQAESEYRAGRYDRSAALYQSYRQSWPEGAHVLESEYGTGWSRFSTGDWNGAIEAFRRVVAAPAGETSLRRDAHLRIADAYYNLHRYRDAAVTYREVLQRDPGAADADRVALSAGDAFIRAEAYESALPVLGEIVTRFPASSRYDDALFWRGWALFRMGEYERAVAEYRKVLELRPPSELEPNARYAIGDAWYNAGRYAEALSAYRELALAHPADPWLAEAVGGLQWALVQLGRADEAQRAADELLTPSTPAGVRERVRLQQARFLFDLERHAEAVPILQGLAGGGNPEVAAEALYWLARSLTVLGRTEEAETALNRLLREHPEGAFTPQARLRLAGLQITRGANAEAIRALEPLLARSTPERAEALYLSATAHRSLGDATRTEVELRRLIDEYPGSPLAAQGRLRMAELAMERGNFNIAQNEVNTLLAERTDELAAEAQYLAGEILFAQQRWNDAEVQFLKVRYVYPAFGDWIARALLRAAQADLRLGNTEKARNLLETALRDHPAAAVAAQVRAELERIRP